MVSVPITAKLAKGMRSARPTAYSVHLHLVDAAPVHLTVHPLDRAQYVQHYTYSATARTFSLPVPANAGGTAFILTFNSGRRSTTLYLLVPGINPRRGLTTVADHERPAYLPLLHLANDAGIFLLCPAALAEQPLSCSVTETAPLPALEALLRQHHYQLTHTGQLGE